MEFENLSKNLKRLRELAGLSQYELGKLSGISRGRISLVECRHTELIDDEHSRVERVLRAAIADRYRTFQSIVDPSPKAFTRAREER